MIPTVLATAALALSLPKMQQVPTVDGVVSADEWKDAAELQRYLCFYSRTAFPVESEYWLGRDAERLYFAARCLRPVAGLQLETAPVGSNVFTALWDDGFEFVFIKDETVAKATFAHLIVNLRGAFYAEGKREGALVSWSPEGLLTAFAEADGHFTFELSIPLKSVFLDGGGRHAVKLCQNWEGRGKHVVGDIAIRTCVMPDTAGYVSSTGGVTLDFDDAAPVVQMTRLGSGAGGAFPVAFRLANVSARPLTCKVHFRGQPERSQCGAIDETVTLEPGAERVLETSVPVQGDEKTDVDIRVTSADGRRVHYARSFVYEANGKPPRMFQAGAADLSPVELKFAYYPSYDTVRAVAELLDPSVRTNVTEATLSITDANGTVVCSRPVVFDGNGKADFMWKTPDLAAHTRRVGSGAYCATLTVGGISNGVVRQAFFRDVFPWEGNRIGLSEQVVPPFEPLAVTEGAETKVGVVLREHTLDALGLLRQVKVPAAEGATEPVRELLAAPMRLVATRGSKTEVVGGMGPAFTEKTATRARMTSELTGGLVRGRVTGEWEYDGLLTWTLTLERGTLDGLRLEIPLRAEEAKLMHACTDGLRFNYAGEVPAGEGRVWDSTRAPRSSIVGDYVPYVWVGGPLRGFAVFGDNDKGWVVSDNVPCQEIVREVDGTVVLRLNLIQKACDITEARTIKLGFMATPVKPMLANWRTKDYGRLVGCCWSWGGIGDSHAICPYDGTPKFWEKMAEARRTGVADRKYQEKYIADYPYECDLDSPEGKRLYKDISVHYRVAMNVYEDAFRHPCEFTWYTNGRGLHLGSPEGQTFCDEWDCFEFIARQTNAQWMTAYSMEPVPSYLDYAAWWWKTAYDLGVLDHLYWDNVFLCGHLDPVGCDAYRTEGGRVQAASGIFAMRRQIKRGATTALECGKDTTGNWIHMTNTAMAPISAFAGYHYDWEDPSSSAPIQERWSRAYIQACTIGRQFGVRVGVKPACARTTPECQALFERSCTGVTLTHELDWRRPPAVQDALRGIGYQVPGKSVSVWNYWNGDVPAPIAVEGVEHSSLVIWNGTGEALLVVSSWTPRTATARIRVRTERMGVRSGFAATNVETGAALSVADDVISVELGKYDYVVIRLH